MIGNVDCLLSVGPGREIGASFKNITRMSLNFEKKILQIQERNTTSRGNPIKEFELIPFGTATFGKTINYEGTNEVAWQIGLYRI